MLSFFKRSAACGRRAAGSKARFQPTLEALEDRTLLSFTWHASTFVLTVRGDQSGAVHNDKFVLSPATDNSAADQIVHYSDGSVLESCDIPYKDGYFTSLDIDGGAGTDTVVVGTLRHYYDIGATNPEFVTVNNGLIGSYISITTTSDGPSTALTLNSSKESVGRWLYLSDNGLSAATPPNGRLPPQEFAKISFLTHPHIGSVAINTGSGNDHVSVYDTPAPTTINTGGGDDKVYVGGGVFNGDLAGLTGTLTVDGGSLGQDQLFVSDGRSTLANSSYTVSSSSFTRGAVTINYSGFEGANFNTGGTGSNVNIKSTAAGVPTVVQTSSAVPVKIGNDAGRLDDIRGSLSVSAVNTSGTAIPGGALTLDDHNSTTAHSYTITRDQTVQVTREDGVSIASTAMSKVSVNAGSANDTFTVVDTNIQAIPTPVSVDGGGGSGDKLIQQPTWSVSFVINGLNQGTAFGVTFNSIENLLGGSGDDAFVLQTGGSLSGTIDGGGGINKLDYSALTTGVTVDLALRVATGVFNNAANGIANIRNVIGSMGDDLLRGDANDNDLRGVDGNDILIGLDGNDTLKARGIDNVGAGTTRRCILIGGNGADTLEGSNGENILIAGYFENNLDLNNDVLRAFLNVWKDTTHDFATRTYSLNHDGVVVNGTRYKVNDANIQRDDGAIDTVFAGDSPSWFWVDSNDSTNFLNGYDEKNDV